jgi:hypothetical protein
VGAWRASGSTSAVYAAEHGLKAKTLLWWSSRLKRDRAPDRGMSFVEVVGLPSSTVRVRFGGAEVEVPQGSDEQTLRAVFSALRSES